MEDADYDFLRSISSSDKNAMKVHQSQLVKSFGNIAQTISETSHSKFNNNEETKTWEAIGENRKKDEICLEKIIMKF